MRYNKTEAKFKSHYILKSFFRQSAINDNDVSAEKSNRKCHSIYLCGYSIRFWTCKSLAEVNLKWDNQLQKYLRLCTVFWHKWPVHDLVLVTPLHPLSKLLAIQDHTQNLEEQLWMEGRREVSIISHRPVTRSDLKQERSFFRGSVSTFLQLVVAGDWFISI